MGVRCVMLFNGSHVITQQGCDILPGQASDTAFNSKRVSKHVAVGIDLFTCFFINHFKVGRSAERTRLLTVCHRSRVLVSAASAAESFRSLCGSVRGAPVFSSQASPIAAPQVLQGTDNTCFRV